jgi:hypothetical protein
MLLLIGNVFYQFLKRKVTWERFKRYLFDWSLILICLAYTFVASFHGLHHRHRQPENLPQAANSPVDLQNSHISEFGMHILIQVWVMNLLRFIATSFGGKFAWQGHWIMEILMMISGKLLLKKLMNVVMNL